MDYFTSMIVSVLDDLSSMLIPSSAIHPFITVDPTGPDVLAFAALVDRLRLPNVPETYVLFFHNKSHSDFFLYLLVDLPPADQSELACRW